MTASAPSPRVSWLIPVYNGESFVREAIESVLAQDYADFEVVIVNDGSTDGTREILAEYEASDRRIKLIDKPNGGIVSALNEGLRHCSGEYLARMDADDIAMPRRLRLQVDHLDRNPDCVIVGGSAISVDREGRPVARTTGGRHSQTDLSVFPARVSVSMHPLITLRKEALLAIGGYRSSYPHAEDYDLFLRLAPFGTVENPKEDMLIYRRHEDAISIRNMEAQERSSALAEAEAIACAGYVPVPPPLLESYVRLRIFRRYLRLDSNVAKAMLPQVMRDLIGASPTTWFDRRHLRLRAIIAANLVKYFRICRTPARVTSRFP